MVLAFGGLPPAVKRLSGLAEKGYAQLDVKAADAILMLNSHVSVSGSGSV